MAPPPALSDSDVEIESPSAVVGSASPSERSEFAGFPDREEPVIEEFDLLDDPLRALEGQGLRAYLDRPLSPRLIVETPVFGPHPRQLVFGGVPLDDTQGPPREVPCLKCTSAAAKAERPGDVVACRNVLKRGNVTRCVHCSDESVKSACVDSNEGVVRRWEEFASLGRDCLARRGIDEETSLPAWVEARAELLRATSVQSREIRNKAKEKRAAKVAAKAVAGADASPTPSASSPAAPVLGAPAAASALMSLPVKPNEAQLRRLAQAHLDMAEVLRELADAAAAARAEQEE